MADNFVTAYSVKTGEPQRIPRHWLEHPVLGKNYRLKPARKARPVVETVQPVEPVDQADSSSATIDTPAGDKE